MELTFRTAIPQDMPSVFAMFPPGYPCEPEMLREIGAAWKRWMLDGCLNLIILEDSDASPEHATVAFGVSVFVRDDFVGKKMEFSRPPIAAALCRMAREGTSPILSRAEIRRTNSSSGLNLLIPIIGWKNAVYDTATLARIKAKLFEALFYAHAGYKLNAVIQEIYSHEEMKRAVAIGARIISDYAGRSDSHCSPIYLTEARRDEIEEGSAIWALFLYFPPRLFFSAEQQDVLNLARGDKSDDEIADILHVTLSTVHKRWKTILARTVATDPSIVGLKSVSVEPHAARGTEKRKYLLRYLRSHPEELRPVERPAAAQRSSMPYDSDLD